MTSAERLAALDAALAVLACPVCLAPLARTGSTLRCSGGHAFDVARQGYAALATGSTVPGDTAPMVRARIEFLGAGHYDAVIDAVADAVAAGLPGGTGWIADLASGPGHYLAEALDRLPGARGIALDAAGPAARAAAGAHPRSAAATADLRTRVPLATGSVDAALVVFGPRNGQELARLLTPSGSVTVVVPQPEHLAELREPFGTLAVAPDKERRLLDRMLPLRAVAEARVALQRRLPAGDVARVVLMGPNGHHLDHDEVRARAERTGDVTVSIAVRVLRFAR